MKDKSNKLNNIKKNKKFNILDKILIELNHGLNSAFESSSARAFRENPSEEYSEKKDFSNSEKKDTSALMRINHTGEVCAQALYRGQAFCAKSQDTQKHLLDSAQEEYDHLIWCQQRLAELDNKTSFLNFIWYSLSFKIGCIASLLGDDYSYGFVVETEKQVEAHLDSHINQIPKDDLRTHAILKQMREDEIEHGQAALNKGAKNLPHWVKKLMGFKSKIMTKLAYYI